LDFEDFESYPNGTILGSQPDWFTEGGTQVWNNGIGGSQGCTPHSNFFVWSAGDGSINRFNWSELAIGDTLVFSMDYNFGSGTNGFKQESVGFTIFPFWPYNGMDLSFNISLDGIPEGGYGIEASWLTNSMQNPTVIIAPIPQPSFLTWYRLRAAFTKLTETSLSIDAQVWQLDAAGKKVSLFASGSIADTSAFGAAGPHPAYFLPWDSGLGLWPVFRNDKGNPGGGDNAYFGIIPAQQ
ncbi:MAG: hypothetical protein V3W44_02885, partial [Dehalococcoidales bacterium]